jgi:hypothetical protein
MKDMRSNIIRKFSSFLHFYRHQKKCLAQLKRSNKIEKTDSSLQTTRDILIWQQAVVPKSHVADVTKVVQHSLVTDAVYRSV